jgi:hypothetical protein
MPATSTPLSNSLSGGNDASYYAGLSNPYQIKNGPLNSLDELLLVQGVDHTLLYGGDTNRNALQDGTEDQTSQQPGLSSFVTVYGRELNVDMTGTARIYLNGDDLDTMYSQLTQAVGAELAAYILASKVFQPQPVQTQSVVVTGSSKGGTVTATITTGAMTAPVTPASSDQVYAAVQAQIAKTATSGQRIRTLLSLIGTQITLPIPDGSPQGTQPLTAVSPLNDPTKLPQLLPLLMDKTTVQQAIEMVPRINVNTAPAEVLMSITDQNGNPILSANQLQAILTQRPNNLPTDEGTVSLAWLITTNTLDQNTYQTLEKYITGTSMVYRVQSVGYFQGGGPTARMEAVIDTNQGAPRFLFVRDLADLENPPAFPPNAPSN